jgi:hypothetical protein
LLPILWFLRKEWRKRRKWKCNLLGSY